MIGTFEYIRESKLLIIKWRGVWSKEYYKKSAHVFQEKSNQLDIENIIQDISELEYQLDKTDVDKMVAIRNKIIDSHYNTVYITAKPKDIVFAYTYAKKLNNNRTMYCSTIERAIQLLLLEDNYNNIILTYKRLLSEDASTTF